jgi:prophage antirepressor-like protein
MTSMVQLTKQFEGQNLTTIRYKGRPCWIAKEVGRVLGYARDGKRLVSNITREWSMECIKGIDYVKLAGDELEQFKKLVERKAPQIPSLKGAPSLILLYESGVHFCCIKTKKPIGWRLRRYLTDGSLPRRHR